MNIPDTHLPTYRSNSNTICYYPGVSHYQLLCEKINIIFPYPASNPRSHGTERLPHQIKMLKAHGLLSQFKYTTKSRDKKWNNILWISYNKVE